MRVSYKTSYGKMYNGAIEDFIRLPKFQNLKGKIDLIFTSPPFPLNRKKAYGNLIGSEYLDWITYIFSELSDFLSPEGSMVIEIGNAWNKGEPTMSTLPLKTLLSIQENSNLYLCQSFIWNNTAKLPSPAQWVNVERCRVKDSFTNIWWMSKSPKPKADNRKVLQEYSSSMKSLIKKKKYNSGKRPSEHNIGEESFFKNNGGAIPGSVISASNTVSSSNYLKYCKQNNFQLHPARMPDQIVDFFVKLLTDENDLVLDPFGGSNTSGEICESLRRQWISVELNHDYIEGSKGRFNKFNKEVHLS